MAPHQAWLKALWAEIVTEEQCLCISGRISINLEPTCLGKERWWAEEE